MLKIVDIRFKNAKKQQKSSGATYESTDKKTWRYVHNHKKPRRAFELAKLVVVFMLATCLITRHINFEYLSILE